MTNAEAWLNIALRPRKPEGSLGRTAQDGHLDSHTAPELWHGRKYSPLYLLEDLTEGNKRDRERETERERKLEFKFELENFILQGL